MNSVDLCWICAARAVPIEEVVKPIYYLCPNCQFLFMDRTAFVDEVEEERVYGRHQNTRDNVGYVQMLTRFMEEAVFPFIEPPGRGLEFGCGPGPVLAELLEEHGFEIHRYDPYFFSQKELLEQTYDFITATEVLEHLHHPREEMQRLRDLLSPGGILAVMTQFHHQRDFKGWHYRRDPTHVCFYAPQTFRWLAEHLGLTLRKVDAARYAVMQKPVS